MARKLIKRSITAFLALIMCVSTMSLTALAEEGTSAEPNTAPTHLLGDAEGDLETFNFKVVEDYIPEEGDDRYAVVGAGEQTEFWTAFAYKTPDAANSNEVPTILTDKNGVEHKFYTRGGGRNINGIYLDGAFYASGSDAIKLPEGQTTLQAAYNGLQQALLMNGNGKKAAVYCVDHVVPTTTAARYTLANIEDATHYDATTAGKIRAVAANGYWGGIEEVNQYGTLEKMKSMMEASDQFNAAEVALLSPGVALSATQFALWELANANDDRQVVNVQYIVKKRVAGYNGLSWNKLVLTPKSEIPCVDLIFKLSNYLTNLDPVGHIEMTTGNTVLSDKVILKEVDIDVLYKAVGHANNQDADKDNDAYVTNVTFDMLRTSEKDNLTAKIVDEEDHVYAIGRIAGALQEGEVQLTKNENGTYTFPGITLVENQETTYTVVVEGVQYLERNVYLYTAGDRETSQTLIGYDEGDFTVYVKSSVKKTFNLDDPSIAFTPGQASNISFMLIDKATGKVEFLYKIDIEDENSFAIPFEAGKISAVFVKQATSGMFWFSEKVNNTVVDATVECLKEHNPSYKGHNAVAFGNGDHTLEFKKNKSATYNFNTGTAMDSTEEMTFEIVSDTQTIVYEVAKEVQSPADTTFEDVVNEEVTNKNKNNKNKNKNK